MEQRNLIGKEILNYRIEKFIGGGGMGSVYLAANKNINQKVVVKVRNNNLADSEIIRKLLKNEAKMLCSLNHPNIVKFINFVENEDGATTTPFFYPRLRGVIIVNHKRYESKI
jgi:serine/threonine-protein kinase